MLLMVPRRLLRIPWTARRSNQSILKKINPEYSLEGLMLKLKLQYVVHLMRRADSLEKTLMLAWDDPLEKEMANCSSILAWIIPWTEKPGKPHSMGSLRVGHNGTTNRTNRVTN